ACSTSSAFPCLAGVFTLHSKRGGDPMRKMNMTYEQSLDSQLPTTSCGGFDLSLLLCRRLVGRGAVWLGLLLAPTLLACDVDENEPETSGVALGGSDDTEDDAKEADAAVDDDS